MRRTRGALSDRVTINAGVRWEPYFGQYVENDAIVIFKKENYDQGIRSKVFLNAPPGLIYPGDEGFPDGKTGLNTQWWNLAPRAGVAWDVRGDGRLAVRSSYSMGYDFMAGEYHNINAGAPPFGNRSLINDPPGRMDDPWGHLGGDPHPIVANPNVAYIPYGAFGSMDPDINSPRAQQWNVTVEQQLGASWGVSASYLGSYADRLWAQTALNPGVFLGLGPCTLNTADGSADLPGVLDQCEPEPAAQAVAGESDQVGPDRRARPQLGRRLAEISWPEAGSAASDRDRREPQRQLHAVEVRGHADRHRPSIRPAPATRIRTTRISTPATAIRTARTWGRSTWGTRRRRLATGSCARWRRTGGCRASSTRARGAGSTSPVASTARSSVSRLSGPTRSSDDIYGPGKDASDLEPGEQINNYFNRDAFALPAPGTLGNATRNVAVGPAFWQVDLAISKLVSVVGTQRLELRFEAFNLFNTFNWGNPATNFNAATFGRITTQAGDSAHPAVRHQVQTSSLQA